MLDIHNSGRPSKFSLTCYIPAIPVVIESLLVMGSTCKQIAIFDSGQNKLSSGFRKHCILYKYIYTYNSSYLCKLGLS